MKVHLLRIWDWLRGGFWFMPLVMSAAALILALGMIVLDQRVAYDDLRGLWWVFSGGAEGARAVLESVTGSLISVISVTFSLTMVVLSLTAQQFGPRLLRNFIYDIRTQIALGAFIGTYIYCMMVLRTIRGEEHNLFVPYIAVTVGFALSMLSVGVLIFYIHHVMSFIQAPSVIDHAHTDLLKAIDRLYPERIGRSHKDRDPDVDEYLKEFAERAEAIASTQTGYLQQIDAEALMGFAVENDVVVHLIPRPGDYVVDGTHCADVAPEGRMDSAKADRLNACWVLGARRTPYQDVRFGFNQLVEIAMFALSTGINDPHTALTCIDRIGSALCRMATRDAPSPFRYDERGDLRIIAEPVSFVNVVNSIYSELRQNAGHNASVVLRLLKTIALISACVHRSEDHDALMRHVKMIREASRTTLPQAIDQDEIEEEYQETLRALRHGRSWDARPVPEV